MAYVHNNISEFNIFKEQVGHYCHISALSTTGAGADIFDMCVSKS